MLNDNEFQELMEDLSSTDIAIRVATLKTLCEEPSEDERVLPHLEQLLNDTTPCVVMLPYRFGEIRWLAAKALAVERSALGRCETVHLHNVVKPINTEELAILALDAGVESRGGVNNMLEVFSNLCEMGRLPLYDLKLVPSIKSSKDQLTGCLVSTKASANVLFSTNN